MLAENVDKRPSLKDQKIMEIGNSTLQENCPTTLSGISDIMNDANAINLNEQFPG